jgi:hypothetical protein
VEKNPHSFDGIAETFSVQSINPLKWLLWCQWDCRTISVSLTLQKSIQKHNCHNLVHIWVTFKWPVKWFTVYLDKITAYVLQTIRGGHLQLFPLFAICCSATSSPLFAIATLLLLNIAMRYSLFAIATFVKISVVDQII